MQIVEQILQVAARFIAEGVARDGEEGHFTQIVAGLSMQDVVGEDECAKESVENHCEREEK